MSGTDWESDKGGAGLGVGVGRKERALLAPGAAGGEEILLWGKPCGRGFTTPPPPGRLFRTPGPDPESGLGSLVGLEAAIFSRCSGREENYL